MSVTTTCKKISSPLSASAEATQRTACAERGALRPLKAEALGATLQRESLGHAPNGA